MVHFSFHTAVFKPAISYAPLVIVNARNKMEFEFEFKPITSEPLVNWKRQSSLPQFKYFTRILVRFTMLLNIKINSVTSKLVGKILIVPPISIIDRSE